MSELIDRRQLLGILAAVALPGVAHAQAPFPSKPITWLLGFPPGGPTDVLSRLIASELTEVLGQSVIVENRPGGGGSIALAAIANAPKDGYTIGMGNLGPLVIAPALQELPYTASDFTPVGKIGDFQTALVVSSSLGVSTVDELVALVKQNPGKYNFASDGIGTTTHLAFELFKQRMGNLDVVHVPLKGSPDILRNYASGSVHMSITNYQSVGGQVAAGDLKVLAVVGSTRIPALPAIPTMTEAGVPGFNFSSFIGLIGPAELPDNVSTAISDALEVVLAKPEVKEKMEQIGGMVVDYKGTQEMTQIIAADDKMWREVIESIGVRDVQ